MSLGLKRRLAIPAVVVAVFGGSAGTALACHGPGSSAAAQAGFLSFHHLGMKHGGVLGTTVTTYLGLQPAQLEADLASGQTLAQIANATPGKSASGLVSAIVAPLKTRLDAAVAAGRLSATAESTILMHVTDVVTAAVNGQWPWWHHRAHIGLHI